MAYNRPVPRDDEDPPLSWDLPGDRAPKGRPGAGDPSAPGGARGTGRPREVQPAAEPDSLTVSQVSARLKALLAREFPRPFWIIGETVSVRPHKAGHIYFNLVDDQVAEAQGRPSLSLKLWSSTVRKLFGPRGKLGSRFRLADGLVVRLLVRPDYWPPGGQISFLVEDVDPDYTLGNLDRLKRELLEKLAAEGALQRNRALALPEVPLVLGLVTAQQSAAWNDVLRTFHDSGLGFRLLACDARMQGERTGPGVCAALATLAARGVDCILLVRGGGSRLDLAWFDREDIARAIADCPVPVLTGIGHEIDTSVADAVAHTSFKTPTAVAEFLVQLAREGREQVERGWADLLAAARDRLDGERDALLDTAARLRRAARERDRAETDALQLLAHDLRLGVEERLHAAEGLLAEARARLERGRHVERLALLGRDLVHDAERLARAAGARIERQEALLELAAQRARLLDPAQVLARGYAWLRRPDGSLLKDAAASTIGERLVGVLRDGELDLLAGEARPREPDAGPGR